MTTRGRVPVVAVAQTTAGTDHAVNRRTAVAAVGAAAHAGADLVVLPEYALAYDPRGVHPGMAEPPDGPFMTAVARAAAQHRVHVCVGTLEPAGERAANVAVLLGPDGQVRTRYRKVHLYDAFGARESDVLQPGTPVTAGSAPVVDVGDVRVGVMLCYDLRFPESARVLVDAGAQVLLVPAAWVSGEHKVEQLRVLARARAVESTAYVVLSSQYGRGRVGTSMVVDPNGVVVAEAAGDGPALLSAVIHPALVAEVRERNPALRLRRYQVVPGS